MGPRLTSQGRAAPPPLTFQRAGVPWGDIGSRSTAHGDLPLSQFAPWADSVCGWTDRKHCKTSGFIGTMISFIHLLVLVKKI